MLAVFSKLSEQGKCWHQKHDRYASRAWVALIKKVELKKLLDLDEGSLVATMR